MQSRRGSASSTLSETSYYSNNSSSRYRRKSAAPRKRISELRFEENRGVLDPLIAAIAELGRLPADDEYPGADAVTEKFGSLKCAFALIQRVTGIEGWDEIRRRHSEDLLVYLALARFRRRPPISKLPLRLQRDLRGFFGTYKRACEQADELLFRAGTAEAVDEACLQSPLGKLLPSCRFTFTNWRSTHWHHFCALTKAVRHLLGRGRGRQYRQAPPVFRQGVVPLLSTIRCRSPPRPDASR